MIAAPTMRIGSDVGGTFADLFLVDEATGRTVRHGVPADAANRTTSIAAPRAFGEDQCAAAAGRVRALPVRSSHAFYTFRLGIGVGVPFTDGG